MFDYLNRSTECQSPLSTADFFTMSATRLPLRKSAGLQITVIQILRLVFTGAFAAALRAQSRSCG